MELTVKGTPQELAEWLKRLREESLLDNLTPTVDDHGGEEDGADQAPSAVPANIGTDLVVYSKTVFREPLAPNMRKMLSILCEKGDAGMGRSELAKALNMSNKSLQGVIGPLGKRAHRTPGHAAQAAAHYPHSDSGLILAIKKLDNGDWHYTMRPEAREAWTQLNHK